MQMQIFLQKTFITKIKPIIKTKTKTNIFTNINKNLAIFLNQKKNQNQNPYSTPSPKPKPNPKTNFFLKFSSRNFTSISRQKRMEEILHNKYNLLKLEIINDSDKHSVSPGSETHFRIFLVSEEFKGKTKVQIHQEIYKLFLSEMGNKHENKLHSLSIITKTPDEEFPKDGLNSDTNIPPKCASKI